MTYEELSNWLQIITGVIITLTFLSGIATIVVTRKANAEKDEKARLQREKIAEINLKVEDESKKRAEAERSLLELQDKLSPRRMTDAEKSNIQKFLTGKPVGKIEVRSDNTAEARVFAKDWVEILQAAGWTVSDIIALIPTGMNGIGVEVRNGDNAPAIALQQAMMSQNIEVNFFRNEKREDDSILMVIGAKF